MEREKQMMASLITAIIAVSFMTISTNVRALGTPAPAVTTTTTSTTIDPNQVLEKCFGVVKAGQNDCDTNLGPGSCSPSVIDASPSEWIYLPKGVCDRLVGGSTRQGQGVSDSTAAAAAQAAAQAAAGRTPRVGETGVQGAETIDSTQIMKDNMILDGGAGLTGTNPNSPSGNSPTPATPDASTDINRY
jgi:uncharacterized membrane protein